MTEDHGVPGSTPGGPIYVIKDGIPDVGLNSKNFDWFDRAISRRTN